MRAVLHHVARWLSSFHRAAWKWKFGIVDTRGMKVSSPACSDVTASTSAAVNEYLRQSPRSFHLLYQADSKSSLGCIHCYLIPPVTFSTTHTHTHTYTHTHTHTHTDISLAMQYRTQLAWLPLYFIMHHVRVWDMDPDFIYVKEWWLSYLRPSEIAVDQCR